MVSYVFSFLTKIIFIKKKLLLVSSLIIYIIINGIILHKWRLGGAYYEGLALKIFQFLLKIP